MSDTHTNQGSNLESLYADVLDGIPDGVKSDPSKKAELYDYLKDIHDVMVSNHSQKVRDTVASQARDHLMSNYQWDLSKTKDPRSKLTSVLALNPGDRLVQQTTGFSGYEANDGSGTYWDPKGGPNAAEASTNSHARNVADKLAAPSSVTMAKLQSPAAKAAEQKILRGE